MMGSRVRIVFLLLAFLFARAAEPIAAAAPAGSRHLTKDERWMNQRLDHFSPTVSHQSTPSPAPCRARHGAPVLGGGRILVWEPSLTPIAAFQDHRQFKQRYFEFLDYHRAPGGPVFLRICGESACDGIPNDYLAVSCNSHSTHTPGHLLPRTPSRADEPPGPCGQVLAKKFGAAVVTPEHRYYGKSSPFKQLTTENLRFLSSKQALFDLAVFRQYYQV
jgi:hypothetical protein